jgi:hypothetical protein
MEGQLQIAGDVKKRLLKRISKLEERLKAQGPRRRAGRLLHFVFLEGTVTHE